VIFNEGCEARVIFEAKQLPQEDGGQRERQKSGTQLHVKYV